MPSFATTQSLIDSRLYAHWAFDPTKRWGVIEFFRQRILAASQWNIVSGGTALGDISLAATTAAQLATAASPLWALTGRNVLNAASEAMLGDAGGGLALATISTGVAANDSTAIRPMTAFGGSVFPTAPATNMQFSTALSPEFDLVVAHATASVANNDTAFHFQAGFKTAAGWDPTQANYDETNNAGTDGAFFSTSATFTLVCNTRIGGVLTQLDTGLTLLDKTRALSIKIDANRVPVFCVDGASTFSMGALTAATQLLPMVSIKTTAAAQKIIKIRAMRVTKLLA